MDAYELRPYQRDGIAKIFDAWRNEARSVLYQMPTGTGKTVLFCEIVRKGYVAGRNILIAVHRKELIEQICDKLREQNIDAGVILAGNHADYTKIVQVASIQTLLRRDHPAAHLVIIDECHHAKAESYRRLWALYPDAKFLGVTATPTRLSGEGFEDVFDVLIQSGQIDDFIRQGFLVPLKYHVGVTPDLSKVKKQGGEYINNVLGRLMTDRNCMADVLKSYRRYLDGRATLVFAVNVEHSREIVARFTADGIPSAHIDAQTPAADRADLLARFKRKDLLVISNVEIITEGFDFPGCEAVLLARPTKSLALYLQMVGRVMRPAPGKDAGIVLDNAGLWQDHGLATIARDWTLHGKAKKLGNPVKLAAMTDDDELIDVSRVPPQEIQGVDLLELTAEIERLFIFESYLKIALEKGYKLAYAVRQYEDHLLREQVFPSDYEQSYIGKRLRAANRAVPLEKQCNPAMVFCMNRNIRERRKQG